MICSLQGVGKALIIVEAVGFIEGCQHLGECLSLLFEIGRTLILTA